MTVTGLLVGGVAGVAVVAVAGWLVADPASRPVALGWVPLALGTCVATALGADTSARRARDGLAHLVSGMAPTYARALEQAGHARLGLDTPADDPTYLALLALEDQWVRLNPAIADVYTFRRDAAGHVALLVDEATDYDRDGVIAGDREQRTPIGEPYPEGDTDEAVQGAFAGRPTLGREPVTDRWGTWISAYEPLRDERGEVEGVLGVDFPAEAWARTVSARWWEAVAVGGMVLTLLGSAAVALGEARKAARRRTDDVERLSAALRAAEAATAARTELLRTVTHEIRNPLNGVIGMSELLLETDLDADQRHCAETTHRAGQLLLQTVDDVLDFAKLEAGAMEYQVVPADVRELAGTVVGLFAEPARRKRLALYAHVEAEVPDRMRLDANRLRQVLVNLVANAVKFTPAGEVELRIARDAAGLVLRVRDTGIGIPPDRVGALFTPFVQAEGAATARRFGGTGLGLSIGRKLVEGMGGTLAVDSRVQHGTTFTVTLPARAEPLDAERRALLRGRRVLVAHPHAGVADAVCALLVSLGAAAVAAVDGSALARVAARPPDLVVCDERLSDALAGTPSLRTRPVVTLVSTPLAGRAGLVLREPVGAAELRRVAAEALAERGARRERTAVPVVVLVVEDNAVNQATLGALLRTFGCGVEVVGTAAEAAAALGRAPFDLLLLGGLPDAERREVVTAARRTGPHDHLPVVSVGAVEGADEAVAWPLRADDAAAVLRRWIPGAFGT